MSTFQIATVRGIATVDADSYRTDHDGNLYLYDAEDDAEDPATAFFPADSYHGVWGQDDGHLSSDG